jgi:hypothetical protein
VLRFCSSAVLQLKNNSSTSTLQHGNTASLKK